MQSNIASLRIILRLVNLNLKYYNEPHDLAERIAEVRYFYTLGTDYEQCGLSDMQTPNERVLHKGLR